MEPLNERRERFFQSLRAVRPIQMAAALGWLPSGQLLRPQLKLKLNAAAPARLSCLPAWRTRIETGRGCCGGGFWPAGRHCESIKSAGRSTSNLISPQSDHSSGGRNLRSSSSSCCCCCYYHFHLSAGAAPSGGQFNYLRVLFIFEPPRSVNAGSRHE